MVARLNLQVTQLEVRVKPDEAGRWQLSWAPRCGLLALPGGVGSADLQSVSFRTVASKSVPPSLLLLPVQVVQISKKHLWQPRANNGKT